MAGPSPYNRKLKARNDRRKARAARGGRTPSEAALGRSMAAAGNRVSKSNRRATAPPSTRTFKSERKPVRARRTSSVDPALRPNAVTGLSEEAQRKTRIVGEDGRELSTLAKAGQIAEVGSALVPVGGGVGTVGRLAFVTGRAAPKAVRAAGAGAKAASTPVKTGSKVKKALKTAPGKTKKKAVQAGKKAKRNVKALGTKKGAGRAAKGAAKAPVKVARRNPAVATGAYTVTADEAGVNDPLTRTIAADTRGIIDAVDSTSDALKTAETTARAVPGALAGVAALGLAGGITAGRLASDNLNRGTGGRIGKDYTGGEVFSPLVEEAEQTWRGTKEIAKPFVEGDQEGVTKAVQEQLGFVPIVASPRLWSAGRNSRPVQKARQAVRDRASQRRTRKNEEELARRDEQRKNLGQRGTKEKKLRGSPPDTRYGGEYAMPRVGRAIEATRQRGQRARDAARAKAQADVQTARILRPVEKLIQGMAVPDGKDAKEYRGGAKNAMAVMLNYGIPRDYDAAVKWMDDIERGIAMPDNPPKISDRGAFKFLRDNPEIFKDEKFWEARDILWRNQDEITTSEVKRYLGAGAALGIKNPDERLEEGVALGDGTVVVQRDRGRQEDPQRQRQLAELKNLRAELRQARRRGDTEEADRLAPIVDRKEKALKNITQATKKAEADFVSETRAAMAERGLETPAYVRSWADREMPDQAAAFPASGVLSQRNWIDRDTKRRSGEAERAWDDFVRDSIYRPRAQRIYHDLVSEFAATNAVRLRSARGNSVFLTMAEIERAVKRGEIDPRDFVAFHSQHFRSAVQDPNTLRRENGIGAFFRLDETGLADLRRLDGEIRDRAADRGNKYIIVPRPGADELVKQFQGQGKYRKMAEVNRLGSRIVLGYNPSWLVAQFVAEGIPAFTAVGLNPARIRRMRQATKERRDNPEFADLFDSTAGQTAGTTVIPRRDRGLDTRGKDITTSAPLTKPDKFGQDILSGLKGEGLGRIDRAKGGGFRKMVLAAQIDREVNGFLGGLGGFLKLDGQVKKKLKGMSPAEQQAYLLRNPKTARALENYLDDVMGNWRAISSREEFAASAIAFYPYVRYALKTAFWGFPKRHPIKTSMLYFLAQLNANELEEIVGEGKPIEWLNYAFPVVSMDGDRTVTPGAARVAPALSVVAEAIGTNNLSRIFGGLSPFLGAGYTAASGLDFTGDKIAKSIPDSLLMGLVALTSMVAPYRAASAQFDPERDTPPFIGSYTPRRDFDEDGNEITVIGGRSSTSEYLGERDVDKGFMSIVNPFQSISDRDFKERQEIIDLLNRGAWRELPGSATSSSSSSSSTPTPSVGTSRSSLSSRLPGLNP